MSRTCDRPQVEDSIDFLIIAAGGPLRLGRLVNLLYIADRECIKAHCWSFCDDTFAGTGLRAYGVGARRVAVARAGRTGFADLTPRAAREGTEALETLSIALSNVLMAAHERCEHLGDDELELMLRDFEIFPEAHFPGVFPNAEFARLIGMRDPQGVAAAMEESKALRLFWSDLDRAAPCPKQAFGGIVDHGNERQ